MKNTNVLILNKYYYPIMAQRVEKAFCNMFTGSIIPLDISFEEVQNDIKFNKISNFVPIYSIQEWLTLPVREYDSYILTKNGKVRIPAVAVCSNYDKLTVKPLIIPTSELIFKRDNYTCVYTGKKLSRNELSIDHIIPVSRGGEDTWENLVTCDKNLNSRKSNMLPEECGLKLKYKPYKPKRAIALGPQKQEWEPFLSTIDY